MYSDNARLSSAARCMRWTFKLSGIQTLMNSVFFSMQIAQSITGPVLACCGRKRDRAHGRGQPTRLEERGRSLRPALPGGSGANKKARPGDTRTGKSARSARSGRLGTGWWWASGGFLCLAVDALVGHGATGRFHDPLGHLLAREYFPPPVGGRRSGLHVPERGAMIVAVLPDVIGEVHGFRITRKM